MKEGINELYSVINLFYTGHYRQCISEASKITTQSLEKNLFMYRAYIALKKYRVVLDEIDQKAPPELLAIRDLAEYFSLPANQRTKILQKIEEQIDTDLDNMSDISILAAAYIYFNEENYNNVLKLLHQRNDLECMALSLQTLLKLNRPDLAKKVAETMSKLDDDGTLTQLAQAWLNIAIGGEKLNDAFYIYQEFIDKHKASVYLLNGQATCCIGNEKYEEAEELLRQALEQDFENYETLVNFATLIGLTKHQDESVNTARKYVAQIESLYPDSHFVSELQGKKIEFDRLCQQYVV